MKPVFKEASRNVGSKFLDASLNETSGGLVLRLVGLIVVQIMYGFRVLGEVFDKRFGLLNRLVMVGFWARFFFIIDPFCN